MAKRKIVTRTREGAFLFWLKRLESGKVKQTQSSLVGRLYGDNKTLGYCCLGVLGQCTKFDGGDGFDSSGWEDFVEGDFTDTELPTTVRKFMGITLEEQSSLIVMNDSQGASFKEIAAYIRSDIMPKALKRKTVD